MSTGVHDSVKWLLQFAPRDLIPELKNSEKPGVQRHPERVESYSSERSGHADQGRLSRIAFQLVVGLGISIAMMASLPVRAQCAWGPEYNSRTNPQDNSIPDPAFHFTAGRGLKVAGVEEGLEGTGSTQEDIEVSHFVDEWPSTESFGEWHPPLVLIGAWGRSPPDDPQKTYNLMVRESKLLDPNESVYHRNKLEFSLEGGWLPINIPFPFDFLLGGGYNFAGLYYTLVPIMGSVRWQIDDIGGPWIFRGNWDATFTLSVTAIPRGAETRYFAYIMGIRRNFIPHRWKIAPYWDGQLGMGYIDAKGPLGVKWAQGQDFTFTLNLGAGVRYNLNPRYSLEAGMHYMHISNLYLSEPKFLNYGINVYGPWVGINIRLGKHHSAPAP